MAKITEESEMAKRGTSDSESEDASVSGSESEETHTMDNGKKGVTEYEKQRLSRIAENRARLEALGLPKMALSLKSSHLRTAKKEKEKVKEDDDEEYVPEDEGGPGSSSSSDHDEDSKDEDFATKNSSGSRKRKGKSKGLQKKAGVFRKKDVDNSEYIDDDEALRQAIALSLQDSAEGSRLPDQNVLNINKTDKKGNNQTQEDKGRKKNKKSFASRLQLTEDELIGHFFQLDEAGKGTLNVRDIQRAAAAHDFLWTDKELVDMIRCFDSDGDGKLCLDDFRKIMVRCNMIIE
ncbi:caltractin-like [Vigna unguiculata]|uniref:caltractin-like n=1 Tax=Vigna unguiculata TaxID=3917 RepID=UPI001016089A|nr:caltractin-like [Vigna unguiculata]